MDKVLVDERHLRRDFFFAPWFLRCCLIADACRASAAGLARSRCCWLRLHRQWVAMPFGLPVAPYLYTRVTAITEDFITTTA